MRDVFQIYFKHGAVQFLFAALFICAYAVNALALWKSWPWVLLVIASAPFFEWVTHKYTLHRPLSETPGFWRDYQIRLHHGHHLHPERRDLQFAPVSGIIIMFIQLYLSYALFIWRITRKAISRFSGGDVHCVTRICAIISIMKTIMGASQTA